MANLGHALVVYTVVVASAALIIAFRYLPKAVALGALAAVVGWLGYVSCSDISVFLPPT